MGHRNAGVQTQKGIHKSNPEVVAKIGPAGLEEGLPVGVDTEKFLEKLVLV